MLAGYIIALGLTIITEFLVYLLFFREEKRLKLLLWSVVINFITNPVANLLYFIAITNFTGEYAGVAAFVIIESLVTVSEVFLIRFLMKCDTGKAARVSIVANMLTASLGIVYMFIGR